jgi:D-apionolactonase
VSRRAAGERNRLLYGEATPRADLPVLRAGPLVAVLDGIDLRYVKAGPDELVRRIYVAVRDRRWGTVAPLVTDLEVTAGSDTFLVTFRARHAAKELDYSYEGTITGDENGQIAYSIDGTFNSDSTYSRIGICVHHPLRETCGRPFRARTPDGEVRGTFPTEIGPQAFVDGTFRPLFDPFHRLEIRFAGGSTVQFEFEGDLWETEDHRNWTDANFKTYSTPAALGPPAPASSGTPLRQRVVVDAAVIARHRPPEPAQDVRLTIRPTEGARVPAIGIGADADRHSSDEQEGDLLRALAPRHLRVALHPHDHGWEEAYAAAASTAGALGAPLELALHLAPEYDRALNAVAAALARTYPIARVLVAVADEAAPPNETTPPELVDRARELLAPVAPGAEFAGGTALYFAQLNRTHPRAERWDGVFYSITPQIHATGDIDLMENLEAQSDTVRGALRLAGGRPVLVSPVTLKPQMTSPTDGDVRQASLFGAAWTAGSLKYLAESSASSLTYYESTGSLGIVERSSDSSPQHRPVTVHPLYHPLADVASWHAAEVMAVASTAPRDAIALATRTADGTLHLLVVNLRPEPRHVVVAPLEGTVTLRRLNEETCKLAVTAPAAFRGMQTPITMDGELRLELEAYEVLRIDAQSGH